MNWTGSLTPRASRRMGETDPSSNSNSRADVERGSWETEEGRRGPWEGRGAPPGIPTHCTPAPLEYFLFPNCLPGFLPPDLCSRFPLPRKRPSQVLRPHCYAFLKDSLSGTTCVPLLALPTTLSRDGPLNCRVPSTCRLLGLLVSDPRVPSLCDLEYNPSPPWPQFPPT